MSDSIEKSPSLLNNLRGFRKQKKITPPPTNLNSSSEASSIVDMNRRRIKPMLDSSDSDGDALHTPQTSTSAVAESSQENSNGSGNFTHKEKQLKFLVDAFPQKDTMVLQDILVRHNWNAQSAMNDLLGGGQDSTSNHSNKRKLQQSESKKKKTKRRRVDADDSDDTGGSEEYADERVFDSDEDSDMEVSDELTHDKRRVLEFMQNAGPNELRLMASCSQKKVEAIIESRPFTGWVDLVHKLQDNKHLSPDLLNAAQRVLSTRNNVQHLMRKCTALAQQMERAVAAGAGVKNQPSILTTDLKLAGYQMVGLNWLAVMHAQGVNGILADEMGLGKTVQVIAFLAHLKQIGAARGPHLIVVPASTLENWNNELARWCPALKVFMYYGSQEDRRTMRISWSRGGLEGYDIVLTTYSMVMSSPEERKMFRITQMHYVVFDEAHMLKNMNTQRYENLVRIKASNRILLTGTPLQNNLLELMSLLIFVMPTMFAGKTDDLKNLFQKTSKASSTKADNEDNDLPPFERDQIAQAKRIMKPFVLRRLKRDVLKDLPAKTDQTLLVPMNEAQSERYKKLIQSFQSDDGTIYSNGEVSGMAMMMDMRKLSNHPLLLRYHYEHKTLAMMASRLASDPLYKETNQAYIIEDLTFMSDYQIHKLTQEYKSISSYKLPPEKIIASGKFEKLDEMLPQLESDGHRVLIFSQFVIMLDVLEEYLNIRQIKYLRLDGNTPVVIRQQLIDQYIEDKSIFVFLLTTKAGGLGINLTAADTVIIHDIDFNPYNDKQAEDRCHRMGQKRPVSIYRLISAGTIEEGMSQMAKEKLKLEREITTNEENEPQEMKSVVRLLTLALGFDSARAASLLSPTKTTS
ncbi:SWI/SNF-related matrix-associated actin-dependent regulator of chromatin subfamily A containing DEAD/H box 1 homolog isoform X1 [Chrysoperla carnea]|uniref:SWI/SNF-related matrix-associated actin-dependent regulator of chromatin subfamily A containing DEAD/H box 1 homolog isoform X1 n=2 Tax=Chrysoperla carnea TaxID=189513 RepID=UPI001D08C717|nr:SWI/SNF-related matrix-associated actin-dependent regulator of chromatin subfamily A containing DEAD/H box 1 homolog isoform X1 [Chrysoperla carnea]